MKLYLKIASRYLFSVKGSTLIISIVAFLGVFLSVTAIILTLGIFSGFQDELKNKILSKSPHIVITLYSDEEEEKIREVLKGLGEVDYFISYKLYNALISKDETITNASIKATDFNNPSLLRFLKERITSGGVEGLVIGQGISELLRAYEGDEITLISLFGIRTPTGIIPKTTKERIGGIFYTGTYDQDYFVAYWDIKKAEKFFRGDLGTNVTEVYLKNPYEADRVKQKLLEKLGSFYVVRSWIDLNKPLFHALELEKLGLFFILLLMVLVASFNITSLLFVKVKEKVRDIAVFKTFGMNSRGILAIFLLVGISIGIAGGLLGILNAYILAFFINKYKLIRVSEEVYMMSYIPAHIKLKDVFLTLGGTLILSFISSLIPALHAARERVIEVLRKE
ncbi:FtsX-like permease family protein [Aquifex sp.]